MRYLFFVLTLVMTSQAIAVDLVCTLPDTYVTRGLELCEELRLTRHIRSADWSNDACASEFLRKGLLAGDKTSARLAARRAVAQVVNDAVDSFNIDFPPVAVAARCGDGTLDTEFGEECDDGNNVNDDGCSASCLIE